MHAGLADDLDRILAAAPAPDGKMAHAATSTAAASRSRAIVQERKRAASPLVRGRAERAALGADLGRHQPLGAGSEAHQHELAGPQFGQAEAAQRFHMHENIRRPLAAREEAEAAKPIEPFDLCPFETARRASQ